MFRRLLLAAAVVITGMSMHCSAARAESFLSWLIDQVHEVQQLPEEIDPMMWMYELGTQARKGDAAQVAQILSEMGIGDIDGASVEEKEQRIEESLKSDWLVTREMLTLWLLYEVGMGEYDDAFCWNPSSDTVFALDTELFGGEVLYGDFFKGLNAICGEELVFSEIREDYTDANLEEGTGVIHISFLVNDQPYTYDVQMMYDWFDVSIFNNISRISAEDSAERRLYGMFDGMQGIIFFYQTPQWAREFTDRTGCPLFESL